MAMKVTSVEENGRAAESGILTGDLVFSLEGHDIDSNDTFAKIRSNAAKPQVARVFRDTEFFEIHFPEGKLGFRMETIIESSEESYKAYMEQLNNLIRAIPFGWMIVGI